MLPCFPTRFRSSEHAVSGPFLQILKQAQQDALDVDGRPGDALRLAADEVQTSGYTSVVEARRIVQFSLD